MSQQLINHSPDLKRLWDEGFEIEIKDSYLLIHHVPYLNSTTEIKYGTLVSTLNLSGNQTNKPDTHVVYFKGDIPCDKDGQPINAIINSSENKKLIDTLIINFLFSSKPTGGYADYYDKMTTYVNILAGPAKSIDASVSEKTFRVIEPNDSECVFAYLDTNSSRAEINIISQKLIHHKIAIIGLGGTGSYILDFVAKTPVKEIHIFDKDYFFQHNSFRSPGAASIEKLRERKKKIEYLKEIYSNLHRNIIPHDCHVDQSNIEELKGMDFIFICVDKSEIKNVIIPWLLDSNISFIDVGMGIQSIDEKLNGILRVTSCTQLKNDHVQKRINFCDNKDIQNEYSKNIQIVELNALNASLAIIKWKKLLGFYHDFENEHHSTYTLDTNMLLNDDHRL